MGQEIKEMVGPKWVRCMISQSKIWCGMGLRKQRAWLICNPITTMGLLRKWRKLSPIKDINGTLLVNSLQRLVKAPNSWALKEIEESPNSMGLEKDANQDGLGKDKGALKPNAKNSMKGKKALARARAIQSSSLGAARVAKEKTLPSSLPNHNIKSQISDGDQQSWDSSSFLLTSVPWLERGY